MLFLILNLILMQNPYIPPQTLKSRLLPQTKGRIWVRGKPLAEVETSSSFKALQLMENKLFPVKPKKLSKIKVKQPRVPKSLSWLKGMKYPDLPIKFDESLVKYLKFFRYNRTGRAIIKGWIQNCGRYRQMILKVLARNKLPSSLLYVAFIESGCLKKVRSYAGALGLWQIMPSGAKTYGMQKNYWVDQRYNPELSTVAVMDYFRDLYFRFSDWNIALAAYNCGYGRMLQSIRRYATNDFWKLQKFENALPRQSQLYVPKLLAVAIADLNRDKFKLGKLDIKEAYSFKEIKVPGKTSLYRLSKLLNIPYDKMKFLNREYIRRRTPPGKKRRPVRIPSDKYKGAMKRLAKISPSWYHYKVYTVKLGDTLTSIAKKFRWSTYKLRKANQLTSSTELKTGLKILVPRRKAIEIKINYEEKEKFIAPYPGNIKKPKGMVRYFYRTHRGDTLKKIAKYLDLPLQKILYWNNLNPKAKITYHMYLQVFISKGKKAPPFLIHEDKIKSIKVESKEFHQHHLADINKYRIIYTVRKHDNIGKLCKKFGTSRRALRQVNGRKLGKLKVGEKLVIYAKKSRVGNYIRRDKLKKKRLSQKKADKRKTQKIPVKKTKKVEKSPARKKKSPPELLKDIEQNLQKIKIPLSVPLKDDISSQKGKVWKGKVNIKLPNPPKPAKPTKTEKKDEKKK
ncbi:MAG: LysM peptidoglycan-binding domain-containing protein [Deltaproteobacteria bacterium]|jgi:membrane-bound lytic murein transglycosylase D|nr:LysM peptidoglycan-binding domain-containing protein [Deltaproteobacteria bacterium]